MTKYEWDSELRRNLSGLPLAEQQKAFEFYNELFEDKIEMGMSESAVVREFGNPFDVARRIIGEYENECGGSVNVGYNEEPKSFAAGDSRTDTNYGRAYRESFTTEPEGFAKKIDKSVNNFVNGVLNTVSGALDNASKKTSYASKDDTDYFNKKSKHAVKDNTDYFETENKKSKEYNVDIKFTDTIAMLFKLGLSILCYGIIIWYVLVSVGMIIGGVITAIAGIAAADTSAIMGIGASLLIMGLGIIMACYIKTVSGKMHALAIKIYSKAFGKYTQANGKSGKNKKVVEHEKEEVNREVRKIICDIKNHNIDFVKGEEFDVRYDKSMRTAISIEEKRDTLFINCSKKHGNGIISVTIPTEYVDISVEAKNSQVSATGLRLKGINAKLENGMFDLSNVSADKVDIENKNGKIDLTNVTSELARIKTTNAPIIIDSAKIIDADCFTTNAMIAVNGLQGETLSLKSSNAKITASGINQSSIDIETSNARVDLVVDGNEDDYCVTNIAKGIKAKPYGKERNKHLRVKTTNASSKIRFAGGRA